MFYNLNLRTVILQGERYLKKREKKKSNGFSGILFSVHIQAIRSSSAGGSIQSTQISVLLNVNEGSTDHSLLFRN